MSKENQNELERNEISEIIASNFDHNGEKWDASDFEWSAHCVQMAGYRKQSEVIDEFADRLKEAPIKCGLPLLGLSTKEEIEEYFNGIMLQIRDAIDEIAKEMKGGEADA